MDWKGGRVLLKHMTDKIKSLGSGNSPVWDVVQKEKYAQNLAGRFAAMKTSGKLRRLQRYK